MAALKEIAREWASELREGIAWVIVWKTGRSWNAQAVWLNCEDEKLEPEDLGLARKVLNQDENAVMLNGYYCGRFFEEMTVEDVAAAIRWHYENGYNKLDGSDVFPDEANQDTAEQPAAPAWMDEAQQEDFREICGMIDTIKSGRDFYRVMNLINGGRYSADVINTAREAKQCFNSAQYEPQQDAPEAGQTDNQQEAGTAAEAASEGRETALGTPETMAGTDATEAAGGQKAAPQGGEINLGKLEAETRPGTGEREPGKQPGGP